MASAVLPAQRGGALAQVEGRSPAGRGNPVLRRRRRLFWPFVAPTLVLYVAVLLGPLLYTAYLSLYRWRGVGPRTFRGLRNYTQLAGDPAFRTAFTNTLIITIGVGIVVFPWPSP